MSVKPGKLMLFLSALAAVFLFITSCGGGGGGGGGLVRENTLTELRPERRKWTFLVYMAADNDLEAEAMRNINQLEAVGAIASGKISVLVLIDRIAGYDSTDGDWTDTRLYEIKHDTAGVNTVVVSKRLSCPALELTEDGSKELDMSDWRVLDSAVTFAESSYPAENYALIVWGHGTGWRNRTSSRAFAVDDTTGYSSSMPVAQMRTALNGKRLSFIGFDTCFSALLEICYELKECSPVIAATPGLAPGSGWNYESVFGSFLSGNLSSSSFEDCLISSYSSQYSGVSGTALTVVDSSKINAVFNSLEALSQTLAGCITTAQTRNDAVPFLMNSSSGYGSSSYPSDWFIDIYATADNIALHPEVFSTDSAVQTEIVSRAVSLKNAASSAVRKSWSADGFAKPLALHLVPLTGFATPASRHSDAYMKGTSVLYKPKFVLDSVWWVPSSPAAQSLLDKLFYTDFN